MVDVLEPGAPGANEALLGIEIATLNKHDLLFIGNALGGGPALPTIVGNEGFGRVLAIGRGVVNVKVGDRVLAPVLSQTWREKMIVPASSLFPLPDGDPHQFSMLSGNPPTAARSPKSFPNTNYHEGAALNGFSQMDHGVAATFEGAGDLTADILVGADGSRSFVRQKLMPDVKPHYAGYVAWRGVVPESSANELLTKTFVDHFTFQQMERSGEPFKARKIKQPLLMPRGVR